MTTDMITIINGIEIKTMCDDTVEVYCDRPSIVRVKDLVEVLTSSTETLVASQTDGYFPQLPCNQHAESSRRVEPA
jgi:hypothetical protein